MKVFGIATIVLVAVLVNNMAASTGKVGGLAEEEKPATDEVQGYINQLSAEIKASDAVKKAGVSGSAEIKAKSYKTQVVAGTNYFVKVMIDNKHFVVRIFKDFGNKVSFHSSKGPIQESEGVGFF